MQYVEASKPVDTPVGSSETVVVSAPAVIADGSARFRATVKWYGLHNGGSPAATFMQLRILRGTELLDQVVRRVNATSPGEGGEFSFMDTPPAGQHCYRLSALSLTGSAGSVVDAAASAPARIRVEELPPRPVVTGTLVRQDAAWTWFHSPLAIRQGDVTYIGWSATDGIWVGAWHHDTGALDSFQLRATATDDHNVAALGFRADGRIIAAYCSHQDSAMRLRISTNPGDVTAWGPEQQVAGTVGSDIITYPNLVHLSSEHRWYLFFRYRPPSSGGIRYITSDDDGDTWSSPQVLINPVGNARPYQRWATNGVDQIHLSVTDRHPNEGTDNSIYHMRYSGGVWHNSAGTSLGSPPFNPNDGTRVYDGTTVKGWNWDIALEPDGNPVMVFATFPNADPGIDHRYWYARWTGSAWVTNQIVPAGNRITTTDNEKYYSGGISLEPNDPSRVYLSRQITPGEWDLEEWATPDGGESWTRVRTIAAGAGKHLRPYAVQGSPGELVWFAGRYDHYVTYDTNLYLDVP